MENWCKDASSNEENMEAYFCFLSTTKLQQHQPSINLRSDIAVAWGRILVTARCRLVAMNSDHFCNFNRIQQVNVRFGNCIKLSKRHALYGRISSTVTANTVLSNKQLAKIHLFTLMLININMDREPFDVIHSSYQSPAAVLRNTWKKQDFFLFKLFALGSVVW